jgi:rRNA processing protein Krr1/Pno1
MSALTESTPLLLGAAVVVIILIAFFSQGKEEKPVAQAAAKSRSVQQAASLKKKKGKKQQSKTSAPKAESKAAPVVEEKKEEEKAAPVVAEEGAKKKKKKAKKKPASSTSATDAAPKAQPAPEKSVSFVADNDDESDDDDVDLWRIQSANKRNKKQTDASKRAAANKEKERERALKKAEADKKAQEEKAAQEAAAKIEAEKEAATKAAQAKKTNGSSSVPTPAPVAPATNGEAAEPTGEKKKRKRKKKKVVDNDDGEPKSTPAAPVQHWETVPVVEEWQEVTHKSSKAKAKEAANEPVVSTEPTVQEDGEISRTIVAGDDPLIFIGKGGATIQMLQDNTGAKFHLDRATNQLTITGKEDAVERGLAEARAILSAEAERKANESSEKVTWGSDAIKAVIGRGGQNIKAVQEVTGAKIDADVEAGTLEITGQRESVQAALTLCHSHAFGEAQDVMELGSRNAVNLVYGPNFTTIRGLQDETGCKLDIARGGTKLKLSGSVEAVALATARVRELLDANRGFEMTIENSKVGAVYGKGGETLRSIQDRTGVQIDVVRGPTHATVSVMGTKESSEKARRSLQRAIDGEIELAPGEVAEEIELGSATAAVIGRGGSNVTDMEKRHGVKINVRSDEQVARVVGKPEKVAAASKDILAIAKPILDAEKAQKKADEAIATGDSAWQVTDDDDADGW